MLPQRLINGCLEQGQADRGKAAATTQARLVDLEDAPDRRRPRDPTMFNLAIGSKLRGSNLAHERPLCARSGLSRLSECVKMVARHNETLATERPVGGMVEDPACLLLRTQAEGTARNDMNGDDLFGLMSALGWLVDLPSFAPRAASAILTNRPGNDAGARAKSSPRRLVDGRSFSRNK